MLTCGMSPTYTHMHTHMHACTYTHTHTISLALSRACELSLSFTLSSTLSLSLSLSLNIYISQYVSYTHTHMHTHANTHVNDLDAYTQLHALSHTLYFFLSQNISLHLSAPPPSLSLCFSLFPPPSPRPVSLAINSQHIATVCLSFTFHD